MSKFVSSVPRKLNFSAAPYIGLTVLNLLLFGLVLSSLGLYRDDWYMYWAAKMGGIAYTHKLFIVDRPYMGLVTGVSSMLVGDSALAWHVYALVLRLATAVLFLAILRLVWPSLPRLTYAMAALYTVYPGFLQHSISITYSNHYITIVLGLLSIWFTLKVLDTENPLLRLTLIGASIATTFYLFIYEYMIGFEAVRLLLFLYRAHTFSKGKPGRFLKSIVLWLPSLIPVAIFLYWRIFRFHSERTETNFGAIIDNLQTQPALTLLTMLKSALSDFIAATFSAWYIPMKDALREATGIEILLSVVIGALAVLTVYWVLRVLRTEEDQPRNASVSGALISVGALWAIAAILPVSFANRHIEFTHMLDRYTLHVSLGAAVFLAGLISLLPAKNLRRGAFFALTFIGVFAGMLTTFHYIRFWEAEKSAWWQLYWRAPDLQEDTALVMQLPPRYQLAEGYEVWAPANLIYQKHPEDLYIQGEVLADENIDGIRNRETLTKNMRKFIIVSNYAQGLVSSLQENGCLHVYDRDWLIPYPNENSRVQEVVSISNISQIVREKPAAAPAKKVFGTEPEHGWCYYYQKAGLAAQFGDKTAFADLLNQVDENKLNPDIGAELEWIPFLEGTILLEDSQRSALIAQKLKDSSGEFCQMFSDSTTRGAITANRQRVVQVICEP